MRGAIEMQVLYAVVEIGTTHVWCADQNGVVDGVDTYLVRTSAVRDWEPRSLEDDLSEDAWMDHSAVEASTDS